MNYPPASTWQTVQLDPKPESEPELVLANPGRYPEFYVPADWPEERRRKYSNMGRNIFELFGSNVVINYQVPK